MRLVLAAACAALLSGGCGRSSTQEPTVDVLVASRNIPKDFLVDATMVRFEKIPVRYAQPKVLHRTDELLGQMTSVTIFEGTQIVSPMLRSIEDSSIAFQIPKGYRSLTLPVTSAAIAEIGPKSFVDVILVSPDPKGKGTVSVPILQNVYVIAVGGDAGAALPVNVPPEHGGGAPRSAPADRPGHTTISLMLAPHEVPKVALAEATAELRYSLRSHEEGNTQVREEAERSPRPMRTGGTR